jgi:hypothetical protein
MCYITNGTLDVWVTFTTTNYEEHYVEPYPIIPDPVRHKPVFSLGPKASKAFMKKKEMYFSFSRRKVA